MLSLLLLVVILVLRSCAEKNLHKEFGMLCEGEILKSEKEKSVLYCWYEAKTNPAWYINSQKIELLNKEPYIIQVYDFIGPNLTKYLKQKAILQFSEEYTEDERKTQSILMSWLYESRYRSKLPTLSKRISDLTGLVTTYGTKIFSEGIRISVQSEGGYIMPHVDAHINDKNLLDKVGDVMATIMIYLNDVKLGGTTAFPSVGVSVLPIKGSAVFWHNAKRNGQVDYMTSHGGCPVLLGDKWLGVKWIYNHPNTFKRKCTLHKYD